MILVNTPSGGWPTFCVTSTEGAPSFALFEGWDCE
jgi:hypothetical protein